MEKIVEQTTSHRRRKLWEVEYYHCSIIGTCFSRTELRKLAKRKEYSLQPNVPDYELHTSFVNFSSARSAEARALHKVLDRKYHGAILRFAKVKTEEALRQLWTLHVEKGSLAGAYWALLTHPAVSRDLASEAHGEIHMIGHDFTGSYQRQAGALEELRAKLKDAEGRLTTETQKVRDIQQLQLVSRQEKSSLLDSRQALQKENDALRRRVQKLQADSGNGDAGLELERLKELVVRLTQENTMLGGRVDTLKKELEKGKNLFAARWEEAEMVTNRLRAEKEELAQEVVSLEGSIVKQIVNSLVCGGCYDQQSEQCPGAGLCGKTVLYVGGINSLVPHYRQLVEKQGGVFVHHDGGKEISPTTLPRMLHKADAVLCPVDCVSHDACLRVKKICKRYQKPFVMMRSAGLSSLAKGLNDIMIM